METGSSNVLDIKEQAQKEIDYENYRKAVEKYKLKLKSKKWWHKLVPFKIILIRRD